MASPPLKRFWDTSWSPCTLDQESCLNLDEITGSFSAPITEEHAWAIVFECLKCLRSVVREAKNRRILIVSHTDQILIHREGRVHESTFLPTTSNSSSCHESSSTGTEGKNSRVSTSSEYKVVQELALVMYAALDIGLKEDEERTLTPGLENLLAHMISAGEESRDSDKVDTDDEGIEQDHDDERSSNASSSAGSSNSNPRNQANQDCMASILGLCESHLSVESEAAAHYRNVCRALVSEALELSFFLKKTLVRAEEHSEELQQLALKDWAHLWINTMNELRHGVKLKKTDHTKTPIEYALTPYEMLMDDIRSRRYKLNKVMVDGDLPHKVKKDAHDIILEFIRSRPPLKPVTERVLPPPRKYSTPQELLMESIRSDEARNNLRKTSGPPELPLPLQLGLGCKGPFLQERHSQPKKSTTNYLHRPMQRSLSVSSVIPASAASDSPLNHHRVIIRPDPKFTQFNPEDEDEDSENELENSQEIFHNDLNSLRPSQPQRPPHGLRSRLSLQHPPIPQSRGRLGSLSNLSAVSEAPLTAHAAEKASPTLTLSHSELTHIRSALSRAKLESLPPDLKSDIVKGNLCFLCTKTKFMLFLNRRHQCQLCQQSVCSKCISKAKLPDDQRFDNVPLFALSPGQNNNAKTGISMGGSSYSNRQTPTTTTSKIKLRRSNTLGRYDRPTLRPNSVAGDSPTSSGASGLLSSFSINSSSPTLNVCLECKQAVESMMMSQVESFQQRRRMTYHESKSRRNVVTKSLILD